MHNFSVYVLFWYPQAKAVGHKLSSIQYEYTHIQPILYALGVGMSTKDPDHLKFLFEGSDGFCCLPTFGVIPAQTSMLDGGLSKVPGLNIDFTKVNTHHDCEIAFVFETVDKQHGSVQI